MVRDSGESLFVSSRFVWQPGLLLVLPILLFVHRYIDDYGRPDPLPAGMLRKMTQSAFLNLFADDPKPAPETARAAKTAAKPAQPAAPHPRRTRAPATPPAMPEGAAKG